MSWLHEAGVRARTWAAAKMLGTTSIVTAFFAAYFWLLDHPTFPVTVVPLIAIDRLIAFRPEALPLYLSLWIYVSLAPALLIDRRELWSYALAAVALSVIGLGTFLLWPTAVPPADVDWSQWPAFAFLQSVDASGNACPSMHVAFAVFTAVWLARSLRQMGVGRAVRALNWLWCLGILYSTVAIRQHVALDVLAGAGLGAVVVAAHLLWLRRSRTSGPRLRAATMAAMSLEGLAAQLAAAARAAADRLAETGSDVRDTALRLAAHRLEARRAEMLAENAKDLDAGRARGLAAPLLERLTLTDARIAAMAQGVRGVADLPDPVGEVSRSWTRPNGLQVARMRIPLGVVLVIYESRPNVTVDVAALCLKSGNAALLRGGSEAVHSNRVLAEIFAGAAREAGLPDASVQLVTSQDRALVDLLLVREDEIDLVIPRGGEELVRRVSERSRIPVIKHYKGVCHVYLDAAADPKQARAIAQNAKCQRPSVCNAAETLLVHASLADTLLPDLLAELAGLGVEIRGCERTRRRFPAALPATEDDWRAEYLSLVLAVRVVDSMDQAIEHIRRFGSSHTEAIVTSDLRAAREFLRRVNSSTVLVNASTRFADGFELGLGAEIGISTSKIHAFGPMGLEGLTTQKFIVYGDGHVRE